RARERGGDTPAGKQASRRGACGRRAQRSAPLDSAPEDFCFSVVRRSARAAPREAEASERAGPSVEGRATHRRGRRTEGERAAPNALSSFVRSISIRVVRGANSPQPK